MAEHLLHGLDVCAGAAREGRCGVAEVVRRESRDRRVDLLRMPHCDGEPGLVVVLTLHVRLTIAEQQIVGLFALADRERNSPAR